MIIDTLFGEVDTSWWKPYWKDMPEFVQEDQEPVQQIIVSFETEEDVKDFAKLMNQSVTSKTKSLWYPPMDREKPSNFIWVSEKNE